MDGASQLNPLYCYLLDYIDAFDVDVADIPAVQLVSELVEATPPCITEANGTGLGQF